MQKPGTDFYRSVPDFARFRDTALYRKVRTRRLDRAGIPVLRLPPRRDGLVDGAALKRFFRAFFEDRGPGDAEFVRIEGARAAS